eukprot:TRINITY_DN1129_c0_g2_i6.p1 TRINITY_DN1129_c0_g2~~TRINITY_DN1129_c0_g2_i6.p1  ORF type:complete len:249 (-),score=59.55 TRINITY_DN1129_c0_g2_i6:631-1377(-)
MAHALVWADFSPAQVQQLEKNAYSPEGKKLLAEYLRLTDIEANPHTRILLSLYHSALLFAKKNFTTLEKIATTISIIKLVHYHNIAEPFVDVEKSLGFFKKLLVEHSVQRPPYSIQIFTIDEVHRLTDYMIETYYRHFKLYKYAFTKKQLLDIKLKEVVIDTAPTIPPLSTATKLDPLAMAQGVDGENGTEAGVDGENLDVRALQSGAISKLSMRSGSPTGIDERVYSATPDALHSAGKSYFKRFIPI